MKRLATLPALVLVTLFAATGSAFAHQGHRSCEAFGQEVATAAKTFGGVGQFVRAFAPLNDEVAAEHAVLCQK